ncbi:MAG TPA: Rieske 2Fe-2S domain-containing protein [Intrasporangiaceae bacterium]|nr:Rieske 2Fe-2S domain-containing protein [Intrasporangiaceae bacterium]
MTTVEQATDVERIAERLDAAEGAVRDLDPKARAAAEELAEALKSLTTSTLTTLVRRLRADERGRELLFDLVDDPVVRMGLLVHGIIRPDPMTLAAQALDRIRPTLHSHGGDVELSHLEEQIAYVRLTGACNGCSMSSVTLRNLVEESLRAAIPSLTAVEVLPNDPTPTVIPVESIRVRPAGGDEVAAREAELESAGWCRAVRRSQVPDGELRAVTLQPADGPAVEAIVVHLGGQITSFVNSCAHQARRLDDALLDAGDMTITCPGHGLSFDVTEGGECRSLPGATLQQLPVQIVDDTVWVRPEG